MRWTSISLVRLSVTIAALMLKISFEVRLCLKNILCDKWWATLWPVGTHVTSVCRSAFMTRIRLQEPSTVHLKRRLRTISFHGFRRKTSDNQKRENGVSDESHMGIIERNSSFRWPHGSNSLFPLLTHKAYLFAFWYVFYGKSWLYASQMWQHSWDLIRFIC